MGEQIPEMWKRVEKLRDKDNHYEDSVMDLAKSEDEIRNDLTIGKTQSEAIAGIANKFSNATLEKIEANQERWTDSLTGLRNKNAYLEEIPQLLNMEKRNGKDCALLMIDFDHFKSVNDFFGHLVGDRALEKMAAMIKDQVRDSDIVYRFGGEEFVVFLSDATSLVAQALAEKIRVAVEKYNIEIPDENGEKIILHKTVSIGAVGTDQLQDWKTYSARDAKEFLDEMTKFADLAVYISKKEDSNKTSRNRVTLYSEDLKK